MVSVDSLKLLASMGSSLTIGTDVSIGIDSLKEIAAIARGKGTTITVIVGGRYGVDSLKVLVSLAPGQVHLVF